MWQLAGYLGAVMRMQVFHCFPTTRVSCTLSSTLGPSPLVSSPCPLSHLLSLPLPTLYLLAFQVPKPVPRPLLYPEPNLLSHSPVLSHPFPVSPLLPSATCPWKSH